MKARLQFSHPNTKGMGTALSLELFLPVEFYEGFVRLEIASQKSPPGAQFPAFDFDNPIRVDLSIFDISRVLMVLRGYCESIEDGNGLYFRKDGQSTTVKFTHHIEPTTGYLFEFASKKWEAPNEAEEARRAYFFVSEVEAFTLATVLEQAAFRVAFGDCGEC